MAQLVIYLLTDSDKPEIISICPLLDTKKWSLVRSDTLLLIYMSLTNDLIKILDNFCTKKIVLMTLSFD